MADITININPWYAILAAFVLGVLAGHFLL